MLLSREQPLRVPELARLRLFVAEAERQREPAREGAAAKVEHAGALDAAVPDERYVGGAAADVDEDATLSPGLLARACPRERIGLRDGGRQLEVELAHDGVDGVDVGHRGERVEDSDLEVLACEADRVGDRVAVDPDVGDRGVDEASLELAVAALELEQVLGLAQRAALDHLQHRRNLARPHASLGVLARIGDRRREALDELARDPHDDLALNCLRHVLGRLERSVAGLDHRLEVRDRPTRHRGGRLWLAPDSENLAVQAVATHHQHLDEVCADVQHREVPVVVAALAQELEFGQLSSCSRRLNASAAGTSSLPRARCGWPPPLPSREARRAALYSGVRSLDTLITN